MTQMTDKNAPRVTIVHHPDVRRALLTQKSYAEGLRALYLYTAAHQDAVVAGIASGADAEMAKVAAAKFFTKNVLPRLTAERKIVEAVDLTAMDLREEAF